MERNGSTKSGFLRENGHVSDVDDVRKGLAAEDKICVKEVLIEHGQKSTAMPPTGKGAFGRLRSDDKFRHRFLHTACVCWTMIALGWRIGLVGPTFPDLRLIMNENLSIASWIFTAIALGGLIGSVCGGALYDRINKTVLYAGLTSGFALFAAVTPFCPNFATMFSAHALHGAFAGGIDTVVTSDMVYVWRLKAGPYMQAAHFAFTIGAIISPFATKPFLAKRIESFNEENVTSSTMKYDIDTFSNVSDFHKGYLNISVTSLDLEMEQYGETNIHVTYFASAAISLSATLGFIILNCTLGSVYAHAEDCVGSQTKLKKREYTLSRPWKICFTLMIAVLLMLYCMNERNFSGFLMTFTITGLGWSKADGAIATSVSWAAFSAGRFTGIYVVKIMPISSVLGIYIAIVAAGAVGFWLSVIYGIDVLVWISIAVIGLGMSVIFPCSFSWLSEKVRRLTGKTTSLVFVILSVGSMLMPILTGYLMAEVSFRWFIYLQMILSICIVALFTITEMTYRWIIKRQSVTAV